jgi:hypothetical protein
MAAFGMAVFEVTVETVAVEIARAAAFDAARDVA